MDDIYENMEEYNPNKKMENIDCFFDDIIAGMLSNKKFNPIVTELFIRERNWTFFLILTHNLLSLCQKNIRLNSTRYFIMKISIKRELQQIAFDHSSDIEYKVLTNTPLRLYHFIF